MHSPGAKRDKKATGTGLSQCRARCGGAAKQRVPRGARVEAGRATRRVLYQSATVTQASRRSAGCYTLV